MEKIRVFFTGCANARNRNLYDVKEILERIEPNAEFIKNIGDEESFLPRIPADVDLLIVDSCCDGAELEGGHEEIERFQNNGGLAIRLIAGVFQETRIEILRHWTQEIQLVIKVIRRYEKRS